MIHNAEIYRKSQKIINYLSFIKNESKDESFQIDSDLNDVLGYLEHLERENLGLSQTNKNLQEKLVKARHYSIPPKGQI